jgi:hypothetical protein
MAGRDEHRDHLAVEITPRGFAVHEEYGVCILRAFVDVVHT